MTLSSIVPGSRGRMAWMASAATLALLCLLNAAPAGAVGLKDFSFTAPSAPTGEKPQSKLWFNAGRWWGSLWNGSAYDIYGLNNPATNAWADTGTRIDTRRLSNQDVLWDGTHLYVLSVVTPTTGLPPADQAMRLFRYSYDPVSQSYTLDAPFKAQVAGQPDGVTVLSAPPAGNGLETAVLTKDSLGTLWIAYTASTNAFTRNVFVTHSTTDDATWATPYIPAVPDVNTTAAADATKVDDIATIVSFAGKVGVMWTDQLHGQVRFASHADGAADSAWTYEVALDGPADPVGPTGDAALGKLVDDHIAVRTLGSQVFAVVKTLRETAGASHTGDAENLLLVRSASGAWTRSTVNTVADDRQGQSTLALDPQGRGIYVISAGQCCTGDPTIYYKRANLDDPVFPAGAGTPLIQGVPGTKLINPTTTKQNVGAASGLLVLAAEGKSTTVPSPFYYHGFLSLAPIGGGGGGGGGGVGGGVKPPGGGGGPAGSGPIVPRRTIETASGGGVRAELSYVLSIGHAQDLRLRILRGGRVARDLALAGECRSCRLAGPARLGRGASVAVRPLDGGREPQVLVTLSGGVTLVYAFDGRAYVRSALSGGDMGWRVRRLARRGAPVILAGDGRFAGAFGARAGSYLPLQVLRLRRGRLVVVTRAYRRALAADAARLLRVYRRLHRAHADVRGVLAAYAGDQYLLRRGRVAERVLRGALVAGALGGRAVRQGPGGHAYLRSLRRLLSRAGYLR